MHCAAKVMRAVQPRQPLVRVPLLQKQRCVRDWYTTHVAPAASQKLVQSARLPPWMAGQFLSDWPPEQWVWSAPLKLPHVVRGRVGAGVVNETSFFGAVCSMLLPWHARVAGVDQYL